MRFITVTIALSALLLGACAASATSVPVKGPQEELIQLAGDWEGEFQGTDSGRVGEIEFELAAGRHFANGQVQMFLSDTDKRPLGIEFVQVKGDLVKGKIEPYLEPNCQCQVVTEFDGYLSGDFIDGTYVTRGVDKEVNQTGRFSMTRKN